MKNVNIIIAVAIALFLIASLVIYVWREQKIRNLRDFLIYLGGGNLDLIRSDGKEGLPDDQGKIANKQLSLDIYSMISTGRFMLPMFAIDIIAITLLTMWFAPAWVGVLAGFVYALFTLWSVRLIKAMKLFGEGKSVATLRWIVGILYFIIAFMASLAIDEIIFDDQIKQFQEQSIATDIANIDSLERLYLTEQDHRLKAYEEQIYNLENVVLAEDLGTAVAVARQRVTKLTQQLTDVDPDFTAVKYELETDLADAQYELEVLEKKQQAKKGKNTTNQRLLADKKDNYTDLVSDIERRKDEIREQANIDRNNLRQMLVTHPVDKFKLHLQMIVQGDWFTGIIKLFIFILLTIFFILVLISHNARNYDEYKKLFM